MISNPNWFDEVQLVDIKIMPFIHYNNVAGAKACYKIKEVNQ